MRTEKTANCLDEEYSGCRYDSGAYRLWVAVTFSAVKALKKSNGKDEGARSFLFDRDNPFVDAVLDQLNIDPDVMRKRVEERAIPSEKLSACI